MNAGEGVEKRQLSCTPGGNVNWYSLYERQHGDSFKKLGIKLSWPNNPTTGHIPWGNHNWKRHIYPNVHCSIIYNSWDMEATYMSIDRWMDKEAVVHMYNGILLSHKKECMWISSNRVDEPRAYYIGWSK